MSAEVIMPPRPQTHSTAERRGRNHAATENSVAAVHSNKKPITGAKKSNDHVFEAKRAEYEKKINAIDSEVKILKPKLARVNEEIRNLTANDGNNAAREQLRGKINALKSEKEKIRAQKEPLVQKLTATQESLKAKVDDLHASKDKVQFKRPEDIDRRISQLDQEIESGTLKLIDEKKHVAEISKLRKLRRELDSFSGQETSIADLKKAADQYRATLADKERELRALDEQLKVVNAELTKLSSTRSANQGKIKNLMHERDSTRKLIDGHYEAKTVAYEAFQKAQADHRVWGQAEQVKREEGQVKRDIEFAIRELENELKKLELPACSDQIEQCINIQNYLRANVLKESVSPLIEGPSGPSGIRQVEKVSSDMILKKDQVEDHYSLASKKPRAKKVTKEAPVSAQVKLPLWIISALSELKVNMVSNAEECKQAIDTLEKVKASFEEKQSAKMANIDSERSVVQSRIEKQKARMDNIPQEAAARIKSKSSAPAATTPKADFAEVDNSVASASLD